MTTRRQTHGKCRTVSKCERRLVLILDQVERDGNATARTLTRHNLATASEAIALNALESYRRQHRAVPTDPDVISCSLENVMRLRPIAFPPNRKNIRRLDDIARQIVNNRLPPSPSPWQTTSPLGVA